MGTTSIRVRRARVKRAVKKARYAEPVRRTSRTRSSSSRGPVFTRGLPDEVIAVMQRIARRGTFADPNDSAS
jgi:hypothetical protein